MAAGLDCVFVHGFTGLPESWDRVWRFLRPPTEANWWRPTLPGHGTVPAPDDLSFSSLARSLASELPSRGQAPAWWIGYSLGARVCCAVAAEVPEAVAGLVLIGVNPGLPDTDQAERRARCAIEQEWAARLRREGLEAFIRYWAGLPLFDTQRQLPEKVRAERQRTRSQHRAEPLARVLLALGTGSMPDYRRAVERAAVPVHLITGQLDTKFDAIARAWSSEAAGVEHLVIPNAGHDPTIEAPESLARALAKLLPHRASR